MRIDRSSHVPPAGTPGRRLRPLKIVALVVLLLLIGLLVAGFAELPLSPPMLNQAGSKEAAQFKAQWQAGSVVVLVRHAERCDRSSNTCLGPADGITRAGQEEATHVGAALTALGMRNTDVLASPLTRTVQTAQAMFHAPAQQQDWLHNCDQDMRPDIQRQKVKGRNLVLVTHSGCIGEFEAQLGFPHAQTAEYTSALVTSLAADGKLHVVGIVNATDWATLIKQ